MDAVEYVKQRNRMCDYYTNCGDCPASGFEGCSSLGSVFMMIPIVEQWAKEHPVKTRQSELLKLFPSALIDDGSLNICPRTVDSKTYDTGTGCIHIRDGVSCRDCRRDFWLKEIE